MRGAPPGTMFPPTLATTNPVMLPLFVPIPNATVVSVPVVETAPVPVNKLKESNVPNAWTLVPVGAVTILAAPITYCSTNSHHTTFN